MVESGTFASCDIKYNRQHSPVPQLNKVCITLLTPSSSLLAQVYNRPPPDPAVIAEYEALPIGATPHSLIDASLVARNDADIEVMSKAFTGDREGYANTHRQPTAETMARVAQDFSAAEDDAGENHMHLFCFVSNNCFKFKSSSPYIHSHHSVSFRCRPHGRDRLG